MDPDPSPTNLSLAVALLPALCASLSATATTVLSALSSARRAALIDSLPSGEKAPLSRYHANPEKVEARWLFLRVVGVAATSALIAAKLSSFVGTPWVFGLLGSILAYAIPTELLRPLAVRKAETLASILLRVLLPLEYAIALVSDPISYVAHAISNSFAVRAPSHTLTETEVEKMVDEGELNGSLGREESEMIRNVLDFGELTARDVMVPRIRVDSLDGTLLMKDVAKIVQETQHSRYPVFTDAIDNISGILHVKDLFGSLATNATDRPILELVRKPVAFVPETMLASNVLHDMRAGRHHMAVVVDEFGGFSGILTLEDLLEEIVGDIRDEHDLEDEGPIKELGEDSVLVDASIPLTDLNRRLGTDLPESDDYLSLGGYLIDQLGTVPEVGSTHELGRLSMTIREADTRHIARVELRGLPPRPSVPPSGSQRNPSASAA